MKRLKLGTRGSPLAVTQATWVRDRLVEATPGIEMELAIIRTTGDMILDRPLREVGGKAVFLKEIEEALLDGRVDLAVHSLKDVPAFLPEGLELAAFPPREDARDVLLAAPGLEPSLDALPQGARVGTSSLRRGAQALARRPDLEIVALRGNVGTRLEKLAAGEMEATMLALSGLRRLGLAEQAGGRPVPCDVLVPAIGQGALAIEVRAGDEAVRAIAARLDDAATRHAVTAERGLLERLEGDCKVPIGGYAVVEGDQLTLVGLVAQPDGSVVIRREARGTCERARELGLALGQEILEAGGREILAALQVES